MSYPLVKFVDQPSVSATVRLDLSDRTAVASRGIEADSFDLGTPSLDGDPDGVGQVFGLRDMNFTVRISGTKTNALAFVSALSKELLRPTNWLMFQLDATRSPIWFKTYRVGYQSLSLEQVYGNTTTGGTAPIPDTWQVEVPMAAEPFAYGARVSVTSATITHALTGTNPMKLVLPAIKGDAPTALRVTLTPLTNPGSFADWLIGCVSGTSSLTDMTVDIGTGDIFTAGTNTAAGVANAADFGGSCRTVTVTPDDNVTGSNFSQRLQGNVTLPTPGRWKVLLRYEAESGSLGQTRNYTFSLLTQNSNGGDVATPVTSVTAAGSGSLSVQQGWLDLGEVTSPFGFNAPVDVTGSMPVETIRLKVGEASNLAGVVRLDALRFIPVSGRAVSSVELLNPGKVFMGTTYRVSYDGDDQTTYGTVIAGGGLRGVYMEPAGSFPTADPAASVNLLIVQATRSTQTVAHATTQSTTAGFQVTVDVSYYPRWLHIGDGT